MDDLEFILKLSFEAERPPSPQILQQEYLTTHKDDIKKKPENKRRKLARPEGFEPPTFGFEVHRSIH